MQNLRKSLENAFPHTVEILILSKYTFHTMNIAAHLQNCLQK